MGRLLYLPWADLGFLLLLLLLLSFQVINTKCSVPVESHVLSCTRSCRFRLSSVEKEKRTTPRLHESSGLQSYIFERHLILACSQRHFWWRLNGLQLQRFSSSFGRRCAEWWYGDIIFQSLTICCIHLCHTARLLSATCFCDLQLKLKCKNRRWRKEGGKKKGLGICECVLWNRLSVFDAVCSGHAGCLEKWGRKM